MIKLAIWYLSKRKVSVIMGFEVTDAKLKSLNNKAYIYSNIFNDVDYRNPDNSKFKIPEGKFNSRGVLE